MSALVRLALPALALAIWFAAPAGAFELNRHANGTPNVVDPSITADPIEVILWVDDDVSAPNETFVTAEMQQALDWWENLPTSHIRFDMTVIRSATEPPRDPDQLLVITGNAGTMACNSCATFPPGNGNPGGVLGLAANVPHFANLDLTAAHEVGHALGLMHSSISHRVFGVDNNLPIMHGVTPASLGPTEDDVAAMSLAYPDSSTPLGSVTGRLHGRVTSQGSSQPLTGAQVVAVNVANGKPMVGRLTGTVTGQPGRFDVVGLPAGSYNLFVGGGNSTAGNFLGLASSEFQKDNFGDVTAGPYSVSAGSSQDVGDLPVAIEPLRTNRLQVQGVEKGNRRLLPTITAGEPYSARLHLTGGVRPLSIESTSGLPPGLTAAIDAEQQQASDSPGDAWLEISGTPTAGGDFSPSFTLEDAHGTQTTITTATAVAEISSHTLSYKTHSGIASDVSVSLSDGTYTISDAGGDIDAGSGCQLTGDPNTVTCTAQPASPVFNVEVNAGDKNDRVTVNGPIGQATAYLNGGDGADTLIGGDGPDVLNGGSGADVLNGRAGFDTASYLTRTKKLRVDIDGAPDDGEPGERDNVGLDVENIDGGSGDDRLIGSAGANVINGNGGKDKIYGYRSKAANADAGDLLTGGDGDDQLFGQAGADQLFGETFEPFGEQGNDRIDGGRDGDYIEPGPGTNKVAAGRDADFVVSVAQGRDKINTSSGEDTVVADDGDNADRISCGGGTDSATRDSGDSATGCESP